MSTRDATRLLAGITGGILLGIGSPPPVMPCCLAAGVIMVLLALRI